MIEELKILLGDSAINYTDSQISLALKLALGEVQAYTKRELDFDLELVAMKIAIIKLNRLNTEGLASQAFSGVTESYIDRQPEDIQMILRAKRKIKII